VIGLGVLLFVWGWDLVEYGAACERREARRRREERDRLLIENALLRAELCLERHPRRRRWWG
jgi:hypothetical protein